MRFARLIVCLAVSFIYSHAKLIWKILLNLLNRPFSNYYSATSTFILLYIHAVKLFHSATQTKPFEPLSLISVLLHAQNVKLLKNTAYF